MENSNSRLSHANTEAISDKADFRQDKKRTTANMTENTKYNEASIRCRRRKIMKEEGRIRVS